MDTPNKKAFVVDEGPSNAGSEPLESVEDETVIIVSADEASPDRTAPGLKEELDNTRAVSQPDDGSRALSKNEENRRALSQPESRGQGVRSRGRGRFQFEQGETFAERYELLGLIGKGGIGAVYKVRHLHLEKSFALKIIYADVDDVDTIKRFQQEAKFATRLDHPGIVRVHDFGVYDGTPYMVMDLHSGEPLSQLIKKKELSQERLLKVFGLILNALGYAHDKSIIHRDIKPGNILVGKDENGEDQVTLVDLGIAKELDRNPAQDMHLTKTGEIFGTPLYMSPEQCSGTPVDARSDIYSLGCVMYECLTGAVPFDGETVFEIINKHLNEAPKSFPSELRNTRLGSRLEAFVLKALAKDKQHRYQYALEMANEIKQIELQQQRGVITDMKLYWKLYASKMHAVQRGRALSSWLLCSLSLIAIPLSVTLFYLPSRMEAEHRELVRHFRLTEILSGQGFGSSMALTRKVRSTMWKKLEKLWANVGKEEELRNLVGTFEKKYFAALLQSENMIKAANKKFETMSLDSLSSLKKMYDDIDSVTVPWTEESQSRAKLYGYCYQRVQKDVDTVRFLLFLNSFLPQVAAACDLVLLVLLLQRFRSSWQTKVAYDKALKEKMQEEKSSP